MSGTDAAKFWLGVISLGAGVGLGIVGIAELAKARKAQVQTERQQQPCPGCPGKR